MLDFRELTARLRIRIIKELPIIRNRAVDRAWAANLRAESVLYVLERPESPLDVAGVESSSPQHDRARTVD
jgi:hypothetical protein